MEVVGTFIESKQLIEKKTIIKDGVRERIKNINSKFSSYSQGSIRSIDILEHVIDSYGIHRVKASISVEISDFKTYIKDSVLASAEIGQGLFCKCLN